MVAGSNPCGKSRVKGLQYMNSRATIIPVGFFAALAVVCAAGRCIAQDAPDARNRDLLSAEHKASALKVLQRCTKRMGPVLRLREKLKGPSGTKLEKFSDPRFGRRLAAWEKTSAEFAAKLSSGVAVKRDLQRYEKAFAEVYSLARWIRLRMLGIDRLLAVHRSPVRSGHVYEYHTPGYERAARRAAGYMSVNRGRTAMSGGRSSMPGTV